MKDYEKEIEAGLHIWSEERLSAMPITEAELESYLIGEMDEEQAALFKRRLAYDEQARFVLEGGLDEAPDTGLTDAEVERNLAAFHARNSPPATTVRRRRVVPLSWFFAALGLSTALLVLVIGQLVFPPRLTPTFSIATAPAYPGSAARSSQKLTLVEDQLVISLYMPETLPTASLCRVQILDAAGKLLYEAERRIDNDKKIELGLSRQWFPKAGAYRIVCSQIVGNGVDEIGEIIIDVI
ncbi:MAG: hypothetical protein QNK37_16585 [Acidobacteriota bacterium]|nr:hypothetical protein [Acidobacteriota bacterium]